MLMMIRPLMYFIGYIKKLAPAVKQHRASSTTENICDSIVRGVSPHRIIKRLINLKVFVVSIEYTPASKLSIFFLKLEYYQEEKENGETKGGQDHMPLLPPYIQNHVHGQYQAGQAQQYREIDGGYVQ